MPKTERAWRIAGGIGAEPFYSEWSEAMTKERFLTVRWNNVLVLALGIPMLLYAAVALSTPVLSARAGIIGLAVIGALY